MKTTVYVYEEDKSISDYCRAIIIKDHIQVDRVINKLDPRQPVECLYDYSTANDLYFGIKYTVRVVDLSETEAYINGVKQKPVQDQIWLHLSLFELYRLYWINRRLWIQKNENIKWVLNFIIGFGLGFLTRYLTSNK